MATLIQLRHDTASRWTSVNPTLAEGEIGIETDTGKIKVGDGTTAWNSLAYFAGVSPVTSVNTKTGAVVLDADDVGATSDVQFNGVSVVTSGVANITDSNIRSVSPACTTITASDTTATLTANTTYAHAVSSSGCTYTLVTPSDYSTAYNGFILVIETTNSASIAFQTDDTPATTISISGNPTIEVGKKYTVTGQFSPLSQEWQLFIISYEAS